MRISSAPKTSASLGSRSAISSATSSTILARRPSHQGTFRPTGTFLRSSTSTSTVPAGASYYLTTSHIYGNTFMPSAPGAGNNISVVVEFSTAGDPDLFFVSGSLRTRELIGGVQGQEHARATITCQRLK